MKRILLLLCTLIAVPSFAQLKVVEESDATIFCAFDIYNGIGVVKESGEYKLLCAFTTNTFDKGLYIYLGGTKEEAINTLGDLRALCSGEENKIVKFDAGEGKICSATIHNGYIGINSDGNAGTIYIHKFILGGLMRNLSFNEASATSLNDYSNNNVRERICRIHYWSTSIYKYGDCFYLSANFDYEEFDMYLGSTREEAIYTLNYLQSRLEELEKGQSETIFGRSQKVYTLSIANALGKQLYFTAPNYDTYKLYNLDIQRLISKFRSGQTD